MKIAQISSPWHSTPPTQSGGTESVVSNLTEHLVALGHEVTLFATGDSVTKASLWSWFDAATRRINWTEEILHVTKAYEYIHDTHFDIIHNHTYIAGPALLSLSSIPSVTTLHLGLNQLPTLNYQTYYQAFSQKHRFISLSRRQQAVMPWINWIGTVYNGINVDNFMFSAEKDDYLLFLGNLLPGKGAHLAIQVAKALGCRLKIAGRRIASFGQADYFEQYIAPHIDGNMIMYMGEADAAQKAVLYQHARALLFPIRWEEPFGMVMIEALASGTPVIAFAHGAVPEVIVDGEVGFQVTSVDEMVTAVKKINHISPWACREHVERHFTDREMAERYVEYYQKIVGD